MERCVRRGTLDRSTDKVANTSTIMDQHGMPACNAINTIGENRSTYRDLNEPLGWRLSSLRKIRLIGLI